MGLRDYCLEECIFRTLQQLQSLELLSGPVTQTNIDLVLTKTKAKKKNKKHITSLDAIKSWITHCNPTIKTLSINLAFYQMWTIILLTNYRWEKQKDIVI